MPLPVPNLDDRTWEQLVQEARARIPGLSPDWTDFNPSDPGITLIELMAWMGEMLLYRLNIVPDKNYLKFLELIGITPDPPAAACAPVTFTELEPNEQTPPPFIPENTPVYGTDDHGEEIQFVTTEALTLVRTSLESVYTQTHEYYTPRTDELKTSMGFSLINPYEQTPMPHALFMGDPELASLGGDITLTLHILLETPAPAPLALTWSYWDGTQWSIIPPAAITDKTCGLSQNGAILFNDLPGLVPCQVYGYQSCWLRVDADPLPDHLLPSLLSLKKSIDIPLMVWDTPDDSNPTNPAGESFQWLLAYNQFDFTPIKEKQPFQPFVPDPFHQPQCYFKFALPLTGKCPFPHPQNALYFHITPADPPLEAPPTLLWEYHNHHGWKPLTILSDTTQHLGRSGYLFFAGTEDWTVSKGFGEWGFWLRARWDQSVSPQTPSPRLCALLLNTVPALHARCHIDEVLGSTNNTQFQWLQFKHYPFTRTPYPPRIVVRETRVDPHTQEPEQFWLEWQEQENFYFSQRHSPHFLLDHTNGKITFGDGIKGRIPPPGLRNVRCLRYYTGGGSRGNIDKGALYYLDPALESHVAVTNPYPALGGSDEESLAQARLRAADILLESCRAITAQDFIQQTLKASAAVDRASCHVNPKTQLIKILVLPKVSPQYTGQPNASKDLCRSIKQYLDRRRPITARVSVSSARFKNFYIHATIRLQERQKHLANTIYTHIQNALKNYFSPYTGGPENTGYPLGRPVHISEVYYTIEAIDGVDCVEDLILTDTKGQHAFPKETIQPRPDQYPFLATEPTVVFIGG